MKIDLGNYKYCEDSELETLGNITDKIGKIQDSLGTTYKVNGTLFKTELGNYIFHGKMFNVKTKESIIVGWKLLNNELGRFIYSLCDNINDENKWELLNYEKV